MSRRLDDKDALGARMKSYERHETGREFLPMLPVYARLDGRGFSKFTKGMERPCDERMRQAMLETTIYMVEKTHALVGYVQSDEISLVWKAADYTGSIFFNGRVTKMTSVLAGMASAAFARAIRGWSPYEDRYPAFDARVIQMPLDYEVANMLLWRTLDAERNAISMTAQAYFSHKQLHRKSQKEMLEMLAEASIDYESMPVGFRKGTWVKRVEYDVPIMLMDIETGGLRANPRDITLVPSTAKRSKVAPFDVPSFRYVANRTEVIFEGAAPEHLARLEKFESETNAA